MITGGTVTTPKSEQEKSVVELLQSVAVDDRLQYAQSVAEAYDSVEQIYLAALDSRQPSASLAASANSR